MSVTAGAPSSRGTGHPSALLEADRRYFAPWGRREIAFALAAAGLALQGVALLGAFHSLLWLLLLAPILPAAWLMVAFFRNPRRRIPVEPGLLVSPADGTIVEVGEADEPEFIGGRALKVAIFLSIFDVHVNRAPAGGGIRHLVHRDGRHLDARDPRSARENESQSIGIVVEEPGTPAGVKILVRPIAGAIARRIVCPVAAGQSVERGGLIGMIKYGSRTELYVGLRPDLPAPEVLVRLGEHVTGGESAIFRLPRVPGAG